MEPQVQYAKTSDGVSIAFASMGDGMPLVIVPQPGMTHVQRQWTVLPFVYPELAQTFRLIWYDSRGSGLSDRDPVDFSMDAMLRDLEAILDSTGVRKFAMLGFLDGVPVAVTYAARSPERVSHLILVDGWTSLSDYADMPALAANDALLDKDWTLYTETMARVLASSDDPQITERGGEHIRACVEPEAWRAFSVAARRYDASAVLGDVRAQTLVLHNNHHNFYPVRAGQRLAAGIPAARFMAIDDMAYQRLAPPIKEFLGGAGKPEQVQPGAFRTVLFTDLVGHTQMMSRLGDERGREVLREHERITREVLAAHGGTEVKTMGDGFMGSFGSVTRAVECASALQKAFTEREGEPLSVRVGLNAGEPIEEEGDLFGATVILAARIAARADGGEILVSDNVRSLCSGKGFLFSDRGEFVAKGFEEPVRVYEVRWGE
jgi:class 3 adenylate cyclase/pimeloyl-ACP methyl ester carboxylesterase